MDSSKNTHAINDIATRIAERYIKLLEELDLLASEAMRLNLLVDKKSLKRALMENHVENLTLCADVNPELNLEYLKSSDEMTLMHDVSGIAANLNRITGKLNNFFLPRCMRSQHQEQQNVAS